MNADHVIMVNTLLARAFRIKAYMLFDNFFMFIMISSKGNVYETAIPVNVIFWLLKILKFLKKYLFFSKKNVNCYRCFFPD